MSQLSVTREEIPERVYDTLVNVFSESQKERVRGYVPTQSLRILMHYVDPDDVVLVTATRRPQESSVDLPLSGSLQPLLSNAVKNNIETTLDYDRQRHGVFPWRDLESWLDATPAVYDLPVRRFVFKSDDAALRDHLYTILEKSLGYNDPGGFRTPLHFDMRAARAGNSSKSVQRNVIEFHDPTKDHGDERYFTLGDQTTSNGDRGLGWPYQTLDLTAVWSVAGMDGRAASPIYDEDKGRGGAFLTQREVEDLAFNRTHSDDPIYGAVNTKLTGNRWRSTFGRGSTDYKEWEWKVGAGWVRTV